MLKISNDSYDRAYGKLLQAKSIATVLLDNINYKDDGLETPVIDTFHAGNLAWAATELIEDALKELDKCESLKGAKNA